MDVQALVPDLPWSSSLLLAVTVITFPQPDLLWIRLPPLFTNQIWMPPGMRLYSPDFLFFCFWFGSVCLESVSAFRWLSHSVVIVYDLS